MTEHVRALQCLAIAKALELYAKHKMIVNRSYTPKAMMATAERLTGKTFRQRDYLLAAAAPRTSAQLS